MLTSLDRPFKLLLKIKLLYLPVGKKLKEMRPKNTKEIKTLQFFCMLFLLLDFLLICNIKLSFTYYIIQLGTWQKYLHE